MDAKDIKKRYEEFEAKHKLPSFKELNDDFEIDKLDRDSDTFLRVIRKTMIEKIVNSMNFVEMLINPVNAPRMYFPYIKSMTMDDRGDIEKIYNLLAELSLLSLDLEIDSTEKKEAEMIKKMSADWKSIKPIFRKIFANMKKPNNSFVKKEKSYYG